MTGSQARMTGFDHDASSVRRVRGLFWSIGVAIGFLQAWQARFWINPDGISYLDHADAWFRRDWHGALSPYWSPLYSWLLGLAMLTRPELILDRLARLVERLFVAAA